MDLYRIGKIEAISLITIIMLNHLILNLPKVFFATAGSAAVLNVIYVFVLALIFLFTVLKLFKNFPGMDILDISKFLGGEKLKLIMGILFLAYIIIIPSFLLRNFCEGLSIIYFSNIPITFLILVFLIVAIIANRFGHQTIIKINTLVVILMLLNLILTFITVAKNFDFENMFPLLGKGINETFLSGATNIYAFSGLFIIYFLIPMLKSDKDFNKISIIGIVISGVFLVLCVLSLLLSFSSVIEQYELPSIYLIVRSAELGKFIQRPEALFIVTWILAMMSYISICIMISCYLFKKIGKTKNEKPMVYCFASLVFIFSLFPKNMAQVRFQEDVIYKYCSIALLFVLSFIILILANLKYKKNNKRLEVNKIE